MSRSRKKISIHVANKVPNKYGNRIFRRANNELLRRHIFELIPLRVAFNLWDYDYAKWLISKKSEYYEKFKLK